jgi:hypothetical protein
MKEFCNAFIMEHEPRQIAPPAITVADLVGGAPVWSRNLLHGTKPVCIGPQK